MIGPTIRIIKCTLLSGNSLSNPNLMITFDKLGNSVMSIYFHSKSIKRHKCSEEVLEVWTLPDPPASHACCYETVLHARGGNALS